MPQGMVDDLKNQQDFQNIQLQIGKIITMQSQNTFSHDDDKK